MKSRPVDDNGRAVIAQQDIVDMEVAVHDRGSKARYVISPLLQPFDNEKKARERMLPQNVALFGEVMIDERIRSLRLIAQRVVGKCSPVHLVQPKQQPTEERAKL